MADKDGRSSTGSPNEPPDPWVERMLHEYPRVDPVIEAFLETVSRDQREHRLTKLGVETGAELATISARSAKAKSIHEVLSKVAYPLLEPLLKGKIEGNQLVASDSKLCTRQLDMLYQPVHADGGRCCFITGLLIGILGRVEGLPRVRVQESDCIDHGDGFCRFEVEVIDG